MSDNNNNEQQQQSNKIFYIAEDEELDNLHNMRYYEDSSEEEYEKDVDAKIDEFREYVRGYIANYMDEKKYTMNDLKKLDNWQYYLLSSCVDLGEIDDDYHYVPIRRTKSSPDLVSDEKLKEFRKKKQELKEENRKLDETQIDDAVLRFKKLYERRAIKL